MVPNTTSPCVPLALVSDRTGRILRVVDLCHPVLREVPGLGRSVCRAAIVVRSVKLVHQRIESVEAGHVLGQSSTFLIRVHSCSARFCRNVEPPFLSKCLLPGI